MWRGLIAVAVFASVPAGARAQTPPCTAEITTHAPLARDYVTSGVDARAADEEWRRTLDAGGAVVWPGTLFDLDGRSFFLLAFTRDAMRIYRWGQLAAPLVTHFGVPEMPSRDRVQFWQALDGCLPAGVLPAATIPWTAVREIEAANWVLRFKLAHRVTLESDRGKRKALDKISVNLHGASGDLQYFYNWNPWRGYTNVRGIGTGPALFQERVRYTLVKFVDPEGRIKLPKQNRGAGW